MTVFTLSSGAGPAHAPRGERAELRRQRRNVALVTTAALGALLAAAVSVSLSEQAAAPAPAGHSPTTSPASLTAR